MSVEQLTIKPEFERLLPHEVERKFLPVFPEQLTKFRHESLPIEQFYLSHPDEPFSLRMRESLGRDGQLHYKAALKNTGTLSDAGISRIEVEAELPPELYAYYRADDVPIIHKLRAEPRPGVAIDFYDDDSVQLESENADNWQQFVEVEGDHFVEITGDRIGSNEWRAHLSFRRANDGAEALRPQPELVPDDIVRDILTARGPHGAPVTIHIGGRSGSGKSTIVRAVREQLTACGLSSVVLSTDDYHRGTRWLTEYNNGEAWAHWDDPIVYDTATMASDLARLQAGQPIPRREIDWSVAEPVVVGEITMSDVIIIEGIYAQAPEITNSRDLSYEMTTPLATCIGRRLLRDLVERPQFADPAASLSYMLREAEPCYRAQKTPESLAQPEVRTSIRQFLHSPFYYFGKIGQSQHYSVEIGPGVALNRATTPQQIMEFVWRHAEANPNSLEHKMSLRKVSL